LKLYKLSLTGESTPQSPKAEEIGKKHLQEQNKTLEEEFT